MGKRTREDDDDKRSSQANGDSAQAKRRRSDGLAHNRRAPTSRTLITSGDAIEDRIKHGLKSLTRALKLAKGFERQKLGKRLKTASKSNDEALVKRLEAETQALKVSRVSKRGQGSIADIIAHLGTGKSRRSSPIAPLQSPPPNKVNC